jgi:hypothetical protein
MESQLMGTTGEGLKGHQGPLAVDGDFLPPADADFSVDRVINLMGSIVGIETEMKGNLALCERNNPLQQGSVVFDHLTVSKLGREMAMGCPGQGQGHQPGGVHIQTMHSRLGDAQRQEVPQAGNHRISPAWAPTGNGQEPPGFVNHYQGWIAIQDVQERAAGHDKPQSMKPRIGRHFSLQAA